MSYQYINHLTAIHQSTRTKPKNIAFKAPESKSGWGDITYEKFWNDITRLALCWPKWLDGSVEEGKRVVGLWMVGRTYTDVVHMFSLQRAGYIPRFLRAYIKDVDLIQSQIEEAGARVVICDTKRMQGWEQLQKSGIKVVPFLTHEEVAELTGNFPPTLDSSGLPPLDGDGNGDDILFITQSSGSTSGCPSVVPLTRRRIDASARKCQVDELRTPVVVRNASFCTTAQMGRALRTFLYADCIVLSPELNWEAKELENLIAQCGVTNLVLLPGIVDDVLEKAKKSDSLAEKLRTLKNITFIGAPLGTRAFESAKEMGINIACEYGLTEVGLMMGSEPAVPVLTGPPLLTFYRKFDYEFIPIKNGNGDDTNLHELVVLPTSPDCPVLALRSPMDGKFHTKDLFESLGEGYVYRGRKSDMILLENTTLLCDAKYIEDRIAYFCHDLISSFVVVGQGRHSLALLVEPRAENEFRSTGTFRNTLLSRLEPLNSSETVRFPHERIKPEYIIILPKGSLPVAPGKETVIRPKCESMFKEMLDKVYANNRLERKDL